MKKIVLSISMMALAFMLLGCSNPSNPKEPEQTPPKYNFKPAPQTPTLPANTGSAAFPFEDGITYCEMESNKVDKYVRYSVVFNSDGSAEYKYMSENGQIREAYKYKYTVNTDTKEIYCIVDKYYYPGILMGIFDGYMTYDELVENFNNLSDEAKFREKLLENDTLKERIIKILAQFTYGNKYTPEQLAELKAKTTDDEIYEFFILMMLSEVPECKTFSDMILLMAPKTEKEYQDAFSTIQKFKYEDDGSKPTSIKRVVYEEATLKDMISYTGAGELYGLGKGDIDYMYINYEFCYFLEGAGSTPSYDIAELKNGKIYIVNTISIDEKAKKAGYKEFIDPIPYTETGTGESLVVKIIFEGKEYELKYNETTPKIIFNN